jgi:hypothetical protein
MTDQHFEEEKLTPEQIAELQAGPGPQPSEEERLSYYKDENPYLHIYGQEQWHGEAFIVANMQALLLLKKAIDDAIVQGHGYVPAFVGDGEGFNTLIARLDDAKAFDKLAVPYNDEIASEKQEDAVWPWKLPRIEKAQEDSTAWIAHEYTPEEAKEIADSIREDREREQIARQGGDSLLAQRKKDRGEA